MATLRGEWLARYETGLHDLVEDFYVPALSASVHYDRKAGFFSSGALVAAAAGIARLVANGGRMRLLVGVHLSPDDAGAMAQGYRERDEAIREALERSWQEVADDIARDRLAALAELVARDALEVRVVAPTDEHGNPMSGPDASGMFHEKAGIFGDEAGDQVVFVGSINESDAAWTGRNIEHFHVFCSWREDAPHAMRQVEDFERLWDGRHPRALTLPFPEALREGLLEYRADEPPERDPLEKEAVAEQAEAEERERWVFQFLRDAPLLPNGDALVEAFSAVSPWQHQRKVYRQACQDYPDRWHLLCDEVGLGKTIEAGLILRSLLLRQRVRRVLILVPKNLIRQWQQELREKFNLWAYWYTGSEYVDPLGHHEPADGNGWASDHSLLIASAHLARRRGRMEELLAAPEWDLVLVDEAHHARRNWAPGEHRPNRMLRLLDDLRPRTRAMLMMTATPMQVEVRELWDLLRLAGMAGRWAGSRGADFHQYFHTLRQDDWSREDAAYLCSMSQEFLAAGGSPDAGLRGAFRAVPGGFNLWNQLSNPRHPADPAKVLEAARQPQFGRLVRELFTRHTPVRELAFRHTRDTLRRYKAQGLLSANIPERDVHDEFISLGAAQGLYDRIETFISDKYRRAEAERRPALGYLMTIYRQRLTSSPWAITRTLQKHLERRVALAEDDTDLDDSRDDLMDDDSDVELEEGPLDLEALWDEIRYVEDFLGELQALGTDPKLQQLLADLEALRNEHPQVVVFTQWTDTMDFLRDELRYAYGAQVACYSGRGGEVWDPGCREWVLTAKDEIKAGFAERRYLALLCTEAASEGLNLQTSDLLINYDMPWNPMRVEQRIGRIDRIGQQAAQVTIRNYYYEGSVEADIYHALRDRLDLFQTAVGPLQPVLGKVAKRIERAAMGDPGRRKGLLEQELAGIGADRDTAAREGLDLGELTDGEPVAGTSPEPPCRPEDVRDAFLSCEMLQRRYGLHEEEQGVYLVTLPDGTTRRVTFRQDVLEQRPEHIHHCLAWGDPLFEEMLGSVPAPEGRQWHEIVRTQEEDGTTCYTTGPGAVGSEAQMLVVLRERAHQPARPLG